MIRIDLGKTGENRISNNQKKVLKNFAFLEQLKIDKADLGGVLLLLGAVAFAFLPHLFVEQFKEQNQKKHDALKAQLVEEQTSLKQEVTKYKSYKSELENFEKQSALLAQRLAAANELLGSRSGPVNTLDALGQSLPAGAWLTQINLSAEPEPSLQISGSAYTSEDVTDFAERLTNSIYFQDVELKEVVGVPAAGKKEDIRTFSFSAVPKVFKTGKKDSTVKAEKK